MKLLHVVVLGYCLTSKAFGNAIPKIGETPSASEDYDKRQIGSLPLKPVICDDYSVIPSDISKAMTQAINSINNNYPKGKFSLEQLLNRGAVRTLFKSTR